MEHFKYNHLPAILTSFHHYNVKGLIKGSDHGDDDDNLLLINIYSEITETTRFVLIDLNLNKFISIFGDYHGYLCANSVYATWSPDHSRCIIRYNNSNSFIFDPNTDDSSTIDCYDISKRDGKLLNSFKSFNKSVLFSFDPTCKHSRLAITSYFQDNNDCMSIIQFDDSCNKMNKLYSSPQTLLTNLSRNARVS